MCPTKCLSAIPALLLCLAALLLAGCGSALQKVVREDPRSPGGYVEVDAASASHRITSYNVCYTKLLRRRDQLISRQIGCLIFG